MQTGDVASAPTEARDSAAWIVLPMVATLAAYAVVITGGFVWDDFFLIVNSPLVTGQGSWFDHFTQPFSNNPLQEARSFYRPLITLSYWIDYRVWGSWPGGFHLTNLGLHLVFVLLLFAMCRRAGASRPVAAWLATLFAVSPRLSESVAWISGRTDIVAGIFVLSAMLTFGSRQRSWLRRSGAGVLLMVGLMCKEVVAAAVVALVVRDWLSSTRPRALARWFLELLPLIMPVAAYGALRSVVMWRAQDRPILPDRGAVTVAVITLEGIARYAWMVLNPFQPRTQIGDAAHPVPFIAAIGVVVVMGAGVILWTKRRELSTNAWTAITLGGLAIALVLPVMPLDLNVIAADRFLYLPLAGLGLLGVRVGEALWQKRRGLCLLSATALSLAFSLVTSARARQWASEILFWREAVAQSSTGQVLPRIELAAALMRRGRHEEALHYLEQVANANAFAGAVNLATCLDKLGHRDAALRVVETVVAVQPQRVNPRVAIMFLNARAHRFHVASELGQQLLADFPYRSDLPSLVSQMEQTMAELQTIPPATDADSTDLKARRATLYDRLGALPEALSLWRDVALNTAADSELRLRAAAYIVLFGYPDMARAVLEQLARQSFPNNRIEALRAALFLRLEDE